MADIAYNRGLPEWAAFTTITARALLLKGAGYTPSKDHDFVADLTVGTNEVAGAGYSRQTLGSKTATIDDGGDYVVYDAADPNFGTIAAGETVTGLVVYRFVTDDTDSILLAYYDITDTATNGTPFVATLHANGLVRLRQAA